MGLRKYNKQLFDETTDVYIKIFKLTENQKVKSVIFTFSRYYKSTH